MAAKNKIDISVNKYLVKGDDIFLLNDFIERVAEGREIVRYEHGELFVEAAISNSMFSSSRVLVLSSLEEDMLESVSGIISVPTEDVWIIIERDTVPKNKAYTQIKAACNYAAVKKPDSSEKAVWIRKWLKESGLLFGEDVPSKLSDQMDGSISDLRGEVEKVTCRAYFFEKKEIDIGFCNDAISTNRSTQFFDFMENLFRKRLKETLDEFRKVDEYSYVRLLHFMIGQIERIHRLAVYREQGLNDQEISDLFGVHVFIVRTKYSPALAFYNKVRLMQIMDMLNTLDVLLRTTKFPKDRVFESYLIKVIKS